MQIRLSQNPHLCVFFTQKLRFLMFSWSGGGGVPRTADADRGAVSGGEGTKCVSICGTIVTLRADSFRVVTPYFEYENTTTQ